MADEELTPEEQKAALEAARKAKTDKEAKAAAEAKAAEEKLARQTNPTEFAGVEAVDGSVEYFAFPAKKDRVIIMNEVAHEHVRTDKDGVWIYRKM